jgi:phytoene dehydrogenase-like protein
VEAAMAKLGAISVTEAWDLVPVRLCDWLERNVPDPMARVVLINQMEASHCSPGEEASVGRWILLIHRGGKLGDALDDDTVGAMQTVIMPWVRAIAANGGELFWGWKPVEISLDRLKSGQGRPRARGIVAVNACNFVRELRAPIVVTDYFGWDLPKLMDPSLLPTGFLDLAEKTRNYQGDVLGWFVGAKRLPRLRSTGEVETFTGWQRVQFGTGHIKRYQGGFYWASAHHARTAPKGKHLLHVSLSHHGVFTAWADAKAAIDQTIAYLHQFYLDLDECMEWAEYQYVTPPQGNTWFLKPTYRHPVKISTVDGLYCVGSSAEGVGGWVADQVENALAAVDLIVNEDAVPAAAKP